MTLAMNRGDFVDSEYHCPNDGKRLIVEVAGDGDKVHVCLNCGHTQLEVNLPVRLTDAVKAVVAQRDIVWPTRACGACGVPVIPAVSIRGLYCPLNVERLESGTFRLFARKGLQPLASWTPLPKRCRAVDLYAPHIPTCGKAVAS
jgi:hypothetical protein